MLIVVVPSVHPTQRKWLSKAAALRPTMPRGVVLYVPRDKPEYKSYQVSNQGVQRAWSLAVVGRYCAVTPSENSLAVDSTGYPAVHGRQAGKWEGVPTPFC